MKIIVPIMQDQISQHFGQSMQLAVYEGDVEDIRLMGIVDLGEHQHTGVPNKIIELMPDAVVCGNLGQNAKIRLEERQIRVVSGASGSPEAAVKAFLHGNLVDRGALCSENRHQNGPHHDHVHEH